MGETVPEAAIIRSAMTADTAAITTTSMLAVTTTTTSSTTPIGTACFATAFGFGSMDLATTLAAIATGYCKEPRSLAAHIGGTGMRTVLATTSRTA